VDLFCLLIPLCHSVAKKQLAFDACIFDWRNILDLYVNVINKQFEVLLPILARLYAIVVTQPTVSKC